MIDARRLLDQFLGSGAQPDQGSQPGAGQGGFPGQAGSPLGGGQGGGLLGQAGGMLGGLNQRARENPLASGALAGGLAAVLLGSKAGREIAGDALKYGGVALIGGLAYKAYRDYQARQSGQPVPQQSRAEVLPPPSDTPFMPEPNEAESRARLLVTAMISAAKADGYIDPDEQKRIFQRLDSTSLDSESKAYVMDQLRAPLDLDGIVREARQPEIATEVYAASLLAIDPDHPAEKAYLQMLAARLGLDDALVKEIHRTAEAAGATQKTASAA